MSSITYNKALEYLHASYGQGIKIGLGGMQAILADMGNPQKKLSAIHVAGTNGKGSTCSYLQYILTEAGYKVGTFTSPHLRRYNERMAINMQPISDDDFARHLQKVAEKAGSKGKRLSFFEILSCMAFCYFAEESVDIAIIETGIGGRLDSTNVIETPLLSVITAPGYDHQELLGESLAEIASEDAGIIKESCPVAVYPTTELAVFDKISKAKNSPLYYIGEDFELYDTSYDFTGSKFSVKTAYFSYQSLSIRLLGDHQLQNAIHALLCVQALREHRKLNITDEAVRRGLAASQWPGRFELLSPNVVMDGAHNEDGARIFKEALDRYFHDQHIILVVGISNSKEYSKILRHMLRSADKKSAVIKKVICTCSPFNAIPAEELADCANKLTNVPIIIEADCKKAFSLAENEGIVAVAGSLYLVGELRSVYNDRFQGRNK